MYAQEHAPMVGNRRRTNSILCHRGTSVTCSCGGDAAARKYDRRIMKRAEKREVRRELALYR